MISAQHVYEVRPRKDHRGVDLISDALQFGRPVVRRAERDPQCNRLRDARRAFRQFSRILVT